MSAYNIAIYLIYIRYILFVYLIYIRIFVLYYSNGIHAKKMTNKNIIITLSEGEALALDYLAGIECRTRKPYIEMHLRALVKASGDLLPKKILKVLEEEKASQQGN